MQIYRAKQILFQDSIVRIIVVYIYKHLKKIIRLVYKQSNFC